MTILEAVFLGIVQGITEFLPISSSGHLMLADLFLGTNTAHSRIGFFVFCHLGTLLAICAYFTKQIGHILQTDKQKVRMILIALTPLFPAALFIGAIKSAFSDPLWLGYNYMVAAGIFLVGDHLRLKSPKYPQTPWQEKGSWRDALCIGTSQVLALLPGISRSGTTISCARILGWDTRSAFLFSFMLAIPTILGATIVEMKDLVEEVSTSSTGLLEYGAGFFCAFLTGYWALGLLEKIAIRGKFNIFVWYCLILGLLITALY